MNDILILIYGNPIAETIRENEFLFPWVESLHVLAVTLVIGSIALVDLRLIGIRALNRPISNISKELLPITWMAFLIAAITGAILFTSNALSYSQNFHFLGKMILSHSNNHKIAHDFKIIPHVLALSCALFSRFGDARWFCH